MNYELIKIVQDAGREVAYMMDKGSGRVFKVFVEDRTGGAGGAGGAMEIIHERLPVRPAPMPGRDGPHFVDVPREAFASGQNLPPTSHNYTGRMVPEGFKAVAAPRPELPDKPAPLQPPAHLAGVFGGTAEEKRIA